MQFNEIDISRLRRLVRYDDESGHLYWVERKQGRPLTKRAGRFDGTYWTIKLDGRLFFQHRVAWALHHGAWPDQLIDHRDGDGGNNRIGNLREADHSGNNQNHRNANANNKLGLIGVHETANGTFRAQIRVGRKLSALGTFDNPHVAHQAYLDAKRRLHSTCTL